jgi:hypothetical protein
MSLMYRLMYRVGFTPWDTGEVPPELAALIEGPGALPQSVGSTDSGSNGLEESQGGAYAAAVDGLAEPGATLLMMAFAPNRLVAAPAGLEESELVGRFADWQLVSASPDTDGELGGPLPGVPRTWYRLVRR